LTIPLLTEKGLANFNKIDFNEELIANWNADNSIKH
jgi:hypothetical protein